MIRLSTAGSLLLAICFVLGVQSALAQDTLYDSQHATLRCTMQFPLAWKLNIIEGTAEKYSAFELIGPMNAAKTFSGHIVISVSSSKDLGTGTSVEYFESFLDKMKPLYSRLELIKRGNISYWGESVPYIDYTYSLPLPLGSAAFVWTTIRERKYVINHNGIMWMFSYSAEVGDYDASDPVFQHLMDTFFFK